MTPNIHLYDTGVDCPTARLFWKMPYQHFAGLVDHNPLIFQTGFSIFSFGVALLFCTVIFLSDLFDMLVKTIQGRLAFGLVYIDTTEQKVSQELLITLPIFCRALLW